MSDFEIQDEVRPQARVVSISGEFDIASTDQARRVLDEAVADREHVLVVDLTRCEFIDSAGLSTLLAAARPRAAEADVTVAAAPDSELRRMLDLTGISLSLPTFETVDDAAAAASSPSSGP